MIYLNYLFMIIKIGENYINIVSYIFGFIGSLIIYIYGIPNQIDTGGQISMVLEQEDEEEKIKIKKFRKFSKFGLSLIALSFLFQIILSILKIFMFNTKI
ncbi:hypothetical protein [Legionella bozemanae]|uniref:hypothetical protein n=1 Tax=Legionella bozemanae TaxID=447 RepID=UPI003F6FDF04